MCRDTPGQRRQFAGAEDRLRGLGVHRRCERPRCRLVLLSFPLDHECLTIGELDRHEHLRVVLLRRQREHANGDDAGSGDPTVRGTEVYRRPRTIHRIGDRTVDQLAFGGERNPLEHDRVGNDPARLGDLEHLDVPRQCAGDLADQSVVTQAEQCALIDSPPDQGSTTVAADLDGHGGRRPPFGQ